VRVDVQANDADPASCNEGSSARREETPACDVSDADAFSGSGLVRRTEMGSSERIASCVIPKMPFSSGGVSMLARDPDDAELAFCATPNPPASRLAAVPRKAALLPRAEIAAS
jgi:hypothetical protein